MKNFRTISLTLVAVIVTNIAAVPVAHVSAYYTPDVEIDFLRTNTPPAGYEDDVRIQEPGSDWFSDIDPSSRIGIAANYLADHGIIGGYPDGTFREHQLVNRAEMAKFITNADKTCHVNPNERNNGRFSDVLDGEWYVPFVMAAARCQIIYGNPDGTFAPERHVNTAEMLAMIARAQFGLRTDMDYVYTDVPEEAWFSQYAGVAEERELFPERDRGRLSPSRSLTRGEVAYVLYQILSENDGGGDHQKVKIDVEAVNYDRIRVDFSTAINHNYAVNGPKSYKVKGLTVSGIQIIDADTVEVIFTENMIPRHEYKLKVKGKTAEGKKFSANAKFLGYYIGNPGGSTLEVELSSSTPMGDTLPRGATVHMMSADFTASCTDDYLIEGLTLVHGGVGDSDDIEYVWMSKDGERIARTRLFDSEDQTADLRFNEPFLVPACETETIEFWGKFKSDAGISNTHKFIIELPSDILTNAPEVSGRFPVMGNEFRLASVQSGTVSTTYRTVAPDSVDIGDRGVAIGKFEFSIDSVEDQTFYSVMLENQGSSVDGSFTNIAVRRADGMILTNTVAQTVADYATLTFDPPFTVLEGDKITLEAVADITSGKGNNIKMAFEEPFDVYAIGSLYGYGVNGQTYGSQVSISEVPQPSVVTIAGSPPPPGNAELTVEINGPVTEEYTPDSDNIVMANVDFTARGEDINVNEMYGMILGQTAIGENLCSRGTRQNGLDHELTDYVEDVELRNTVTGQTVDAINFTGGCAGGGSHAEYRFRDFVLRDSSRWEMRMDFVDGMPQDGDKFRAYVCSADEDDPVGCDFGGIIPADTRYNFDAVGLATGKRITNILPGEDVAGNFMEVASADLRITERALGTSDTVVENAQDVTLFRFEATAGKAEDIFITQFNLKADEGTLVDAGDYTLWVDSDDNGSVDTILDSGRGCEGTCDGNPGNGRVNLDDIAGGGYTIPAEETVMFEVHADISGSLSQDVLSVGFADRDTDFIEAEEADDGTSLDINGICVDGGTGPSSCSEEAQIHVSTATSKVYNLKNQGTLYVTQDAVPTRSRQLLAGELGEAILRLEMRAEDEPIDVTRLVFTDLGTSGQNKQNMSRIKLYKSGESTPFASATKDNCHNISSQMPVNSFCTVMESQQLIIPEGDRIDVLVRPQVKSDEEGAVSASNGMIHLVLFKPTDFGTPGTPANTTGLSTVTARGFESSNVLYFNDGDSEQDGEIIVGRSTPGPDEQITGNRNDTVLAKIVSIEDVNTDVDGSNVPIGTNKRIAEFKFTAGTNQNTRYGRNKATLADIVLNVSSTNVEFDNGKFEIYNKSDQTQKIACTQTGTEGSFYVTCSRTDNSLVDLEMDSGESVTLVMETDILNNQISSTQGSSLQVSITDFSDRSVGGFGPSVSHIQWSDSINEPSTVYFGWIEYPETEVSSTAYQQ
jgi:hypothetical protein